MANWFQDLFGIRESESAIRQQLRVEGEFLHSDANGRRFRIGRLETPSLAELRERANVSGGRGPLRVRNIVGEAGALHRDPEHAHALVQAASQFNLLEMVSPDVTPEAGVTDYIHDRTQGPACAMAAAAATVYRNWFAPVGGQIGQTADTQIDCLSGIHDALRAGGAPLWEMQNGYAILPASQAEHFRRQWNAADRDALRARLRIGLHWDVETTAPGAGHLVSQAYCSALPLGVYAEACPAEWREFARLILEALYEATLLAAVENAQQHPDRTAPVFLTFVGGGVFGNRHEWIHAAIQRALDLHADSGLDVRIVHFRRVDPRYRNLERG